MHLYTWTLEQYVRYDGQAFDLALKGSKPLTRSSDGPVPLPGDPDGTYTHPGLQVVLHDPSQVFR